jgi:hypothetical protein
VSRYPAGMQDALSPANLDRLSTTPDRQVDAILDELTHHRVHGADILNGIERLADGGNGACAHFIEHATAVPAWVDWDLIAAGRRAWLAHMPAIGIASILASLLASYASPRASRTLVSTGRLQRDMWQRAVIESATLLRDMTASDDAMRPHNVGWQTLLKVRILHAKVARHATQQGNRPEQWGLPISQLELTFGRLFFTSSLFDTMNRLGHRLTDGEQAAIHHMWRYANYLLGADESTITTTVQQENDMFQLLSEVEFGSDSPDPADLARAFVRSIAAKLRLPRKIVEAVSWAAIGDAYARELRIPRHLILIGIVIAVARVVGAIDTVGHRATPFLQPRRIAFGRRVLEVVTKDIGDHGYEFRTAS